MNRLPVLPASTDAGYVYVVKRGEAYKIGFTRSNLTRRVREAGGSLVLTIRTGQQPSQLEYIINNRFASQRLPPQGNKPGDKREWFALTESDISWLTGLGEYLTR